MAISAVQQGLIVQNEFAKLVMFGSNGEVELTPAMTDDDRRDFEAHLRRRFDVALAIQCKSALRLHRNGRLLKIGFSIRESRIVSDPLFWYFFCRLDVRAFGLSDPVFLVPSTEVHRHANPVRLARGLYNFTFQAGTGPRSRDRWSQYRVPPLGVGARVRDLLQVGRTMGLELATPPSPLFAGRDLTWAGIPRRRSR